MLTQDYSETLAYELPHIDFLYSGGREKIQLSTHEALPNFTLLKLICFQIITSFPFHFSLYSL